MPADANRIDEDGALESPGVSSRVVWLSVVGFLLFTLLAMAGLQLFFGAQLGRHPQPTTVFKEPRLQSQPRSDLAQNAAAQRERLAHGRMSIDEAMARIAARGDKAYDPVEEAP